MTVASFEIPHGASVHVVLRAVHAQAHPGVLYLPPRTMETFKAELCPDSRHLSDIVGIRIDGAPVQVIPAANIREGHVYWRIS